jgi:probable rRNA maturation factor
MRVDVASKVPHSPPAPRVRSLLSRAARLIPGSRDSGLGTRDSESRIQNPKSKIGEVSVLFCGDRRMRTLNRRYRRKDRSTDVLAFPAGGAELLGDIVISVPYASRQARRRGEPRSREIERLLVHGLLHLHGYDHETDDGEMDALEARMRRRLGLEERTA